MPIEPVRVKAYGLVDFTRPKYLVTQSIVLAITTVLLVVALTWEPTGIWAANPIFANLEWLFLIVLVAEIGETAVMLQKFAKKEAARQNA